MTRFIWIFGFIFATMAHGNLNPDGIKCGDLRCKNTEYCSPYDSQCRACAYVCDTTSRNYQAEICIKDCQEYLHDQKYVLRTDLERGKSLRAEINSLKILVKISLSLTVSSIIVGLILLVKTFFNFGRVRVAWGKIFGRLWKKKSRNGNQIRDDIEAGPGTKVNGLKLAMPTISATVAPSSISANGASTPNTTSTPLSRRHPTEDKTLDFAYDNPAMTPSPETAQARTKRESSF